MIREIGNTGSEYDQLLKLVYEAQAQLTLITDQLVITEACLISTGGKYAIMPLATVANYVSENRERVRLLYVEIGRLHQNLNLFFREEGKEA